MRQKMRRKPRAEVDHQQGDGDGAGTGFGEFRHHPPEAEPALGLAKFAFDDISVSFILSGKTLLGLQLGTIVLGLFRWPA